MRFLLPGLVAASLALGAAAATAQTGAQPRDPNMPSPNSVPAEKIAPPLDTNATGSTRENLSDRLQRTEGVIAPPSTSTPDMTVQPPVANPNSTPVIRPPGTSPTDPVQPK
jgi:hypothetical protein